MRVTVGYWWKTTIAVEYLQANFHVGCPACRFTLQPEVQLFGLEGRYAHALFSAASKSKTLSAVEKELDTIKTKLGSDKVFNEFMNSPVLSRGDKVSNVNKVSNVTLSVVFHHAGDDRDKSLAVILRPSVRHDMTLPANDIYNPFPKYDSWLCPGLCRYLGI